MVMAPLLSRDQPTHGTRTRKEKEVIPGLGFLLDQGLLGTLAQGWVLLEGVEYAWGMGSGRQLGLTTGEQLQLLHTDSWSLNL